jgi:hypothetical protein
MWSFIITQISADEINEHQYPRSFPSLLVSLYLCWLPILTTQIDHSAILVNYCICAPVTLADVTTEIELYSLRYPSMYVTLALHRLGISKVMHVCGYHMILSHYNNMIASESVDVCLIWLIIHHH